MIPPDAADEDRALFARAAACEEAQDTPGLVAQKGGVGLTPPTPELDIATALLYRQIACVPANAHFLLASQAAQAMEPTLAELPVDIVGVVPGAFHQEHRHTGADGARVLAIAREMGCDAQVIPTASFGTLDHGARTILDWLDAHRGKRMALLSLSKGGAEVKRALSHPEAAHAFAGVAAWVSFSGMVQGTPLVSWLHRRPLRWWGIRAWLWWKGHGTGAMDDLRHWPDRSVAAGWPAVPAHLRVVHVYGFPLRRHLAHPWAERGYARLSPLGPNDGGGILLADLAELPGVVCLLWGVDHYMTPDWNILPLLRGIVATALADGGAVGQEMTDDE